MGRKTFRQSRSAERRMVKTLIRQTMLCLIIVLLAILIKKMDAAMAAQTLNAVQSVMARDYSAEDIRETMVRAGKSISALPAAVGRSVKEGQEQNRYIQPCNEEALVMVFGMQESGNGGMQGEAADGSGQGSTYSGLRYAAEHELQVYASSGGTVLSVEGEPGRRRIRISHGGEVETQYAGCCSVYVEPLQKVRRGELIASVAPAQVPGEESCLTFSVWKNGESADPADYIRF